MCSRKDRKICHSLVCLTSSPTVVTCSKLAWQGALCKPPKQDFFSSPTHGMLIILFAFYAPQLDKLNIDYLLWSVDETWTTRRPAATWHTGRAVRRNKLVGQRLDYCQIAIEGNKWVEIAHNIVGYEMPSDEAVLTVARRRWNASWINYPSYWMFCRTLC